MSNNLLGPASAARSAALACLAVGAIGCARPPATNWAYNPPAVVDRAAYDEILAAQQGKVVLVDFWATWCIPCLAQLPHSVELADKYGEKLTVVAVSMDDPTDAVRVHKQLLQLGAAQLVNLISEATGSEGFEAFEIEGGALPHYKVYDRAGKLRHSFAVDPAAEKQFTPDDVAAAVAELVDE